MPEATGIAQFDHFIPVSTTELLARLTRRDPAFLDSEQQQVLHLVRQVLGYEFNLRLNRIKALYQPFNPDNELLLPGDAADDGKTLIESLRELLTAANYTELNQDQIQYALQKTSPYGLEIGLDFDDFAHVSLFYRGKIQHTVEVRDWRTLYLKKKRIRLLSYQRLFLVLRFKDNRGSEGIHLKLFKDIPRPDLEMLFPNSRVRMKVFDKIKIAITGGGGTVGGLFATISKISAAISPWTIVIAVAGFAALLWRQVSKVFIQKTRYMATLAQNLYFHNLDNNAGAITYLVDMARQEEIKEAVLAYAVLCQHRALTPAQLDDACEAWFSETFEQTIDFDVSDAIAKLIRLRLIVDDDGKLHCTDAADGIRHLRGLWEAFASHA